MASSELAEVLRGGHPSIDFVCAPTPEIGPDAVAAFFRAAAGLFRAQPWKTVPSDQSLFSVTIEKLGVKDAAMSVIGQLGQSFGLILFSGIDDFEAYGDAADAIERGEKPAMPPHFALSFDRGAELSAALRREIAELHWEVADSTAYPPRVVRDTRLRPALERRDEGFLRQVLGEADVADHAHKATRQSCGLDPPDASMTLRVVASAIIAHRLVGLTNGKPSRAPRCRA